MQPQKSNISAQIIADSVTPSGRRLTSWVLKYPRFIHSEFMTHRAFSRNAASSRAIPIKKMVDAILELPADPEFWGKNQKGMQALESLGPVSSMAAKIAWLDARDSILKYVERLNDLNVHKQIVNRLIEPWSHITVLATASDHRNFFSLRAHPEAQPEFQVLAYRMLDKYLTSTPIQLGWGDWHTPFGDKMPQDLPLRQRLMVATARAARVSYLTFDGVADIEKDYAIFDKLKTSGHWSPFEHSAQAVFDTSALWLSNFGVDWLQYRKQFVEENKTEVDLQNVLAAKPNWIRLSEEDIDKPESL